MAALVGFADASFGLVTQAESKCFWNRYPNSHTTGNQLERATPVLGIDVSTKWVCQGLRWKYGCNVSWRFTTYDRTAQE
jgi:hypothetical protein